MIHTTETRLKIGTKLIKNKNAEKYNYSYALNLFINSLNYINENDCFVLVQVATAMEVPRKRYSYLAKKFPTLKPLYLMMNDYMEVNVYDLTNSNKMPTRLAIFLLNYVYGYAKKIKENQSKEFRSR